MDTNPQQIISPGSRGPYRRRSPEFKRAVVEETLRPGASVARIARERGINANQLFTWRRAYREGRLDGVTPALLPVEIVASSAELCDTQRDRTGSAGSLIVKCTRGRLQIEGRPDGVTLRLVLEQLLR